MNATQLSQEIKINKETTDTRGAQVSTMERELSTAKNSLTVSQRASIGFAAGVAGALAVVLFSHVVSQMGLVVKGPIPFPIQFKSPGIYQPLFWGGLWGIGLGLFFKTTWKGYYLSGLLYMLAPMLATFLFFLPRGGAGYFGLQQAGPMFSLYVLLVNVPFGIVTAFAFKAITGVKP